MRAQRIIALATVAILGGPVASAVTPAPLFGQSQYEQPPDQAGPYTRPRAAVEAISLLKSPYCPGQMLSTCPSGAGAALRDSLADLAEQGWTTDELVEWVVGNHGEIYRALPKTEGAGLLAWAGPPAAGVAGIVIIVLLLARIRKRREARGDEPLPEVSDEDELRLQEALQQLELEEEAPFL